MNNRQGQQVTSETYSGDSNRRRQSNTSQISALYNPVMTVRVGGDEIYCLETSHKNWSYSRFRGIFALDT